MKQCGIIRDSYLLNAHLHPLRGLRQGITIKNFGIPARGVTKEVIGISRLARKGGETDMETQDLCAFLF
jgi:hypothetical protein